MNRVTASAPVRLDLAGGWTDVAPFATTEGGVVVNVAIDLRTRVTITWPESRYVLESGAIRAEADEAAELDGHTGVELLAAAVRRYDLPACRVQVHAAAPPGSGLGSSGALSVALVAALEHRAGARPDRLGLAQSAWELETRDAAVAGGKQDQCAAACGGFHRWRFGDTTTARPIGVSNGFAEHLARHLVICHTGASRFSGTTIARVMDAYRRSDPEVCGALRAMKEIAAAMEAALTDADLDAVGRLLSANWREQLRLDAGMRTPAMEALETAMHRSGAIGGKAAGSGAGGVMFFVVPGETAPAIAVAERAGATVLPTAWAAEGVRIE